MPTIKKSQHVMDMYEAILRLENAEECRQFIEDLCSSAEVNALEQRYAVADLLTQGAVYQDILARTGASTATISRVKRVLYDGSGCLKRMIEKVKKDKRPLNAASQEDAL